MRPVPFAVGLVAPLLGVGLAAQVSVEVRLPPPLGGAIAETLTGAGGARVRVRPAAAMPPPAAGTVVIALDPVLQELAGHVPMSRFGADVEGVVETEAERRWLLPWTLHYGLLARASVAELTIDSFESLALRAELQDRLQLCLPAIDSGPWLLGMRECLHRGQTESAGYGLWTALDARIGSYVTDYDDALAALGKETIDAAIVPTALLRVRGLPTGCQVLPLGAEDGLAIGIAAVGADQTAAMQVALAIVDAKERQRVADRFGLSMPVEESERFAPAEVASWLRHFDERIRGKGRRVERIADLLDYAFVAGFAAALLFLWWRQHKGKLE